MSNKIYNLVPDLTVLISILLAYFLNRAFPIIVVVPYPVNLMGWLMVAAGIGIVIHVLFTFKSKRTSLNPVELPSMLVTNGLYSYSRNPFYFSYVIITIGTAFILGSLTAFIAPIICFTMLNSVIIPIEERNMQNKFGQKYEQYKHSVRRWL